MTDPERGSLGWTMALARWRLRRSRLSCHGVPLGRGSAEGTLPAGRLFSEFVLSLSTAQREPGVEARGTAAPAPQPARLEGDAGGELAGYVLSMR